MHDTDPILGSGTKNLNPNFYEIYRSRLAIFSLLTFTLFGAASLVAYQLLEINYNHTMIYTAQENLLLVRSILVTGSLLFTIIASGFYWLFLRGKYVYYESRRLLLQSQKIIELNSKMAELGQLSSTLIHEVNNPLGVVDLALNALARREDYKENQLLGRAIISVDKIKSLVRSVRRYGFDSKGEVSNENFYAILAETLILVDQTLRIKKIQCIGDVDREIYFTGDPSKMSQVLINLIINAKDALENAQEHDRWIKIETQIQPQCAPKILISNGGEKMSKQIYQKIFEPYFTTKARGLGTGLGLPTCQKILEEMNLTIGYENNGPHTLFIIEGCFVQGSEKHES